MFFQEDVESADTEETQCIEAYSCPECNCSYDSLEAYEVAHDPLIGICNGILEQDESDIQTESLEETSSTHYLVVEDDPNIEDIEVDATEAPLWEIINEAPEKHVEEDVFKKNKAHKYFCYDCQDIFENQQSAEQHVCSQIEAAEPKTAKPTTAKKNAGIKAASKSTADFTCSICNTSFKTAKSLQSHSRIHNKCTTIRTIQDALPIGAQQTYNELDQFYCEICNKSFDKNLLNVHKQMHQNPAQDNMCGICNRKFDNKSNFDMHMKIVHSDSREAKPSAQNAIKPTSIETDGKLQFPCQYCGRVFMRPHEKVRHERIHTGEKPYKCEVCGKTFRVTYSLTLHLRTHTDIRPYVCTICNKRFKSHQVYAHHLRIHSAERQYVCDMCPKAFRTSVQLYAHKKTHTKPFLCVECNRPFASLYAVNSHMLKHKKDQDASVKKGNSNALPKNICPLCGAEYARQFALRLHMRAAHDQTEAEETPVETDNMDVEQLVKQEPELFVDADKESAVLIAAAEADRAYVNSDDIDVMNTDSTYGESIEISADAFDVHNFHNEEVITDW